MSLWAKITNPFRRPLSADGFELVFCKIQADIAVKRLALAVVVNILSGILAQSEFQTYKDKKRIKKKNYYKLNIEPNKNDSAVNFWREVVAKLVMDNEALVVNDAEGFLLADTFKREEFALIHNRYSSIVSKQFNLKARNEGEVFYFNWQHHNIREIIDSIYSDYGKLIEYSKNHYKRSNAQKAILEIEALASMSPDRRKEIDDLLNKDIRRFFEAEGGAVLPISKGFKYTDLTNNTYKNASDSRDIRALIDDVFDYVAMAFGIAPQLLKGSVADADKAWDSTMIGAAKPLVRMIETEINRKLFTYEEWEKGEKVKIDTSQVKVTSVRDLALAIDMLTRNSVNTLDDNLEMLGREPIGGDDGATRFATKNLTTMDQLKEGGNE